MTTETKASRVKMNQRRYYQKNREKLLAYHKKWVLNNKDKIKIIQREWRAKNRVYLREKYRLCNQNNKLKRKYGITSLEYRAIHNEQKGRCAICGRHSCANGDNLGVDHDHETKKVRGLLCRNCNTALGLLEDNPEFVRKMLIYLGER